MKKMIFGRATGLISLIIGLVLGIVGLVIMFETGYIYSIFFAAPTLILIGFGMMLFPGKNITFEEVNGNITYKDALKDKKLRDERNTRQLKAIAEAPLLHKIVWGILFAVGIAFTIYLLIEYTV